MIDNFEINRKSKSKSSVFSNNSIWRTNKINIHQKLCTKTYLLGGDLGRLTRFLGVYDTAEILVRLEDHERLVGPLLLLCQLERDPGGLVGQGGLQLGGGHQLQLELHVLSGLYLNISLHLLLLHALHQELGGGVHNVLDVVDILLSLDLPEVQPSGGLGHWTRGH